MQEANNPASCTCLQDNITMLYRLQERSGLPCSPHTFRRTFASNLHRAGLDVEHIMRLGGWESLNMVLRYARSVRFEESLRLYRGMERESLQ